MPRLQALEDRTLPSTFTVTNLLDSGVGSLRQAILDANAAPGDDTITFEVTGTIQLAGALPNLSSNIDLQGPGASSLTVRRNTGGFYRIFTVGSGTTVCISGLTITNGVANDSAGGGGIFNSGTLTVNSSTVSGNYGGGIVNNGTLTLNNATVGGNIGSDGVGIYNSGTLALNNATVSDNYLDGDGSGVGIYNGGTLTLNNVTVSDNISYDGNYGGGIANFGTATLNNSTISGNRIFSGGGIDNFGTLTLNNATVSGNAAYRGGGIDNFGTLTLNNATVSGNSASNNQTAGGITNYSFFRDATVIVLNSTIANNTVSSSDQTGSQLYSGQLFGVGGQATMQVRNTLLVGDGSRPTLFAGSGGTFLSQGYTLSSDSASGFLTGPGDLTNTDPLLGPLQDNGGPTLTHALLPGSPALNAGGPDQLGVADQRGVARAGGVNIGAYQASASALVLTAPATPTAGTPFDLTVQAVDPFGQTAIGYTGNAHFASSDGQADLPNDYTFVAADNGVHTFPSGVTLEPAGNQTITVTDTATASITGSATVGVNPAAADHLLFLQQPTDTAAGQTITPAVLVAVVDQFGNVVASDNTDSMSLSIGNNPSGGTLSGTLTLTVVNGVATFSDLSIDLAGDGYTLHATTTGLADADSGAFRITA
jgi:hypothetical protein